MSGLFGGSKSKQTSTSSNQAYPLISQLFGGAAGATGTASDALTKALTGGSQAGLDAYKSNAGYQSTLDAGSQAITGNAASRGLLSSGATAKALTKFGQDTNQQYYQNYLQNLLGLGNLGLGAGGLISGAGQTSKSTGTSSSKPGLGGFLGGALSAIPGI